MKKVVPHNAKLIPGGAKRVFEGVMFNVHQWEQEMFDGTFETFEMLSRPDMLKVVAIVDGKIVLVNEEQPATGSFIDLPGGRHDYPTESTLQAAQREMLEETGMTFKNWRLVEVSQPQVKVQYFGYLYLATDLIDTVDQNLDAGEKISVELKTFEEYRDLFLSGKLRWWPDVLHKVNSLEEILELPGFEGKEIQVVL